MAEHGHLTIHTQKRPEPARPAWEQKKEGRAFFRWKRIALPAMPRLRGARLRERTAKKFEDKAPGERLLRDTAIACALLLGVMTMRNMNLSWTNAALGHIEKAVTMRVDLDESLGRLRFVREWMPEAALVFWNSGASKQLKAPVDGQISHKWSQYQPWRIYSCADGAEVKAAREGEVKAIEQGREADYIVLLNHEGGLQTVYAYMSEVNVAPGDHLYAGDPIGKASASGQIYFEARRDGVSVDPEEEE